MSGLSCGLRDLLLWCAGFSLVVAHGLSCPVACGILVPQPGIEPASPALIGRWILNHWTTREVPGYMFLCLTQRQNLAQCDWY